VENIAFIIPKSIQLTAFENAITKMEDENNNIYQRYKDLKINDETEINNLQILPELHMVN